MAPYSGSTLMAQRLLIFTALPTALTELTLRPTWLSLVIRFMGRRVLEAAPKMAQYLNSIQMDRALRIFIHSRACTVVRTMTGRIRMPALRWWVVCCMVRPFMAAGLKRARFLPLAQMVRVLRTCTILLR